MDNNNINFLLKENKLKTVDDLIDQKRNLIKQVLKNYQKYDFPHLNLPLEAVNLAKTSLLNFNFEHGLSFDIFMKMEVKAGLDKLVISEIGKETDSKLKNKNYKQFFKQNKYLITFVSNRQKDVIDKEIADYRIEYGFIKAFETYDENVSLSFERYALLWMMQMLKGLVDENSTELYEAKPKVIRLENLDSQRNGKI